MAGLGEILKKYDEYYLKNQTLPQNTTAYGTNTFKVGDGAQNGSLEVVAEAIVGIDIAATTVLTIAVQHEVSSGVWEDIIIVASKTGVTGGSWFAPGTILGRVILPSTTKDNTRIRITTTDAAATGSVDVNAIYVPR